MGIKNLLVTLKDIQVKQKLEDLRGKKVAVDGYSWLHKAVYKCGYDIVVNGDYTKFLESFMNKVVVLKSYNIDIVIVYDGDRLPSKDGTNEERASRRAEKLKEAIRLMELGKFY